jgi:hypothetical protein
MKKKINNSGAGHGPVQPTKGSAPESRKDLLREIEERNIDLKD